MQGHVRSTACLIVLLTLQGCGYSRDTYCDKKVEVECKNFKKLEEKHKTVSEQLFEASHARVYQACQDKEQRKELLKICKKSKDCPAKPEEKPADTKTAEAVLNCMETGLGSKEDAMSGAEQPAKAGEGAVEANQPPLEEDTEPVNQAPTPPLTAEDIQAQKQKETDQAFERQAEVTKTLQDDPHAAQQIVAKMDKAKADGAELLTDEMSEALDVDVGGEEDGEEDEFGLEEDDEGEEDESELEVGHVSELQVASSGTADRKLGKRKRRASGLATMQAQANRKTKQKRAHKHKVPVHAHTSHTHRSQHRSALETEAVGARKRAPQAVLVDDAPTRMEVDSTGATQVRS